MNYRFKPFFPINAFWKHEKNFWKYSVFINQIKDMIPATSCFTYVMFQKYLHMLIFVLCVCAGKRTRCMSSGYRTWTTCGRNCRSMWGSTTPPACPGTLGAATPWTTLKQLHPTVGCLLPHHVCTGWTHHLNVHVLIILFIVILRLVLHREHFLLNTLIVSHVTWCAFIGYAQRFLKSHDVLQIWIQFLC